jgi:hypothetical protein
MDNRKPSSIDIENWKQENPDGKEKISYGRKRIRKQQKKEGKGYSKKAVKVHKC